ncbi:MAG: divalent-cation tolerance protein CutA [Candidatus Omnitrophica bacterium]|nr:divalent-cation tolerance protein CutA [Candidatus Omnitrophota bacterium]
MRSLHSASLDLIKGILVNIVILITTKDVKEARRIGQALVSAHLIACVNIMDGVQSLFWWQGKVDSSREALMIIKTKKSCFEKIVKTVKRLHSYQTPEIIALPIVCGEQAYVKWLEASCSPR